MCMHRANIWLMYFRTFLWSSGMIAVLGKIPKSSLWAGGEKKPKTQLCLWCLYEIFWLGLVLAIACDWARPAPTRVGVKYLHGCWCFFFYLCVHVVVTPLAFQGCSWILTLFCQRVNTRPVAKQESSRPLLRWAVLCCRVVVLLCYVWSVVRTTMFYLCVCIYKKLNHITTGGVLWKV